MAEIQSEDSIQETKFVMRRTEFDNACGVLRNGLGAVVQEILHGVASHSQVTVSHSSSKIIQFYEFV